MKKLLTAYLRDTGVVLGITHRDSNELSNYSHKRIRTTIRHLDWNKLYVHCRHRELLRGIANRFRFYGGF